jgi:hypothetical protein
MISWVGRCGAYVDPARQRVEGYAARDQTRSSVKVDGPTLIDVIIVYDQSRFYETLSSRATGSNFASTSVRVQSVTQPIDDDGLFGSYCNLDAGGDG